MTPGRRPAARRAAAGFTLVELMIALLLSLLLAVAILKMQTKMASQSVRMSDTSTRDSQVRAALDLITRDLTGSGFLLGNMQFFCDTLITYNKNGASTYFAHHPVDSLAASAGQTMAFAPTLTLNYPTATTLSSDVLVSMAASAATGFNDVTAPLMKGYASGAPLSNGTVYLNKQASAAVGDTVIVQVPIGTSLACMRAPLSAVGSVSAPLMTSTASTTMPSTFYNGFVTPVANAISGATLTNVGIFNSRVVDIGTAASSAQLFNVYYVDGTTNAYPVLMRAQYNLIDDSVITAPQPIAAGVVALRVSYGIDSAGNGTIGKYEDGPTVTSNKDWALVRSVRVALVTRTINDDPSADGGGGAAPTTIPIGAISGAAFTSITVPSSKHRFITSTTEVAYRNWIWKN
jgi:type IV pilus assembly protein PilW